MRLAPRRYAILSALTAWRPRAWGRAVAAVMALLSGFAWPALAQSTDDTAGSGTSYVTPFPPGDIYKLQVYGDEFAEALLQGLIAGLGPEDRVELARKHKPIVSLIRPEQEDAIKAEEQSRELVHIGVIMIGLEDRGPIRVPGGASLKFGTEPWKDQYGQRADRLIKALKRRNIAVYVVGQPPLRRPDNNTDAETINELLRERAFVNGVRFIEVAASFLDENGAFSQFGPDLAGNRQKLREGDGYSFTQQGRAKLAAIVERDYKRDLAAARSERAVPLAGSDIEQKRINPEKAAAAAAQTKSAASKDGKEARQPAGAQPAASAQAGPTVVRGNPGQGDQKAESSRISVRFLGTNGREEVQTLDIIRPAIPAAVIALLTRKETVDAIQPPFDLLADDVGDGISVSTMVTALSDNGGNTSRRRGSSNQAAYTAVWVKGERLLPKPGRADDFSWPRPDELPYTPVAAAPAPPSRTLSPTRPGLPGAQPQIPRARRLPGAQPGANE